MANIVVGPVIGKVTDKMARVAIEVDSAAAVTCIVTDGAGAPVKVKQQLEGGRFKAFELTGLKAETGYDVSFQGAAGPVAGKFRTMAKAPVKMNIGAVSCNFTIRRGDTDLWEDLRDRYVDRGKLSLLLHVGDQIYGDNAFQEAMAILGGRPAGTAAQQAQILELYRRLYRMTWRHPPTREVLARVPNLMIWDDHEIRDDWGSKKTDYDPNSPEYHVGTLARQAFREYQRQLWDDPVSPPADGLEDHAHAWGQVGVLLVDQRGGRTFERDPAQPYLSQRQWDRISGHFKKGGELAAVRALVVVTTVPLVYLGDSITNGGEHFIDDLGDHWAYGAHRSEQIKMLRMLRYWKYDGIKRKEKRELLVVGGDVHIGCQTDIEHDGKTVFKQLITSPITNKPPGWFAYTGLKGALEAEESLSGRYTFEHHNYTRHRNYGIIMVRVRSAGKTPKVIGGLEIP